MTVPKGVGSLWRFEWSVLTSAKGVGVLSMFGESVLTAAKGVRGVVEVRRVSFDCWKRVGGV